VTRQSKRDVEDIYEISKALEAVAVKIAIERITDDDIKALSEVYELMEFYTLKGDLEKLNNVTDAFHNIIYSATGNSMIINTLSSCRTRLRVNPYRKDRGREYLEEELAEHEAIFMAIVAKDKETAAAASVRHIRNGKKRANL